MPSFSTHLRGVTCFRSLLGLLVHALWFSHQSVALTVALTGMRPDHSLHGRAAIGIIGVFGCAPARTAADARGDAYSAGAEGAAHLRLKLNGSVPISHLIGTLAHAAMRFEPLSGLANAHPKHPIHFRRRQGQSLRMEEMRKPRVGRSPSRFGVPCVSSITHNRGCRNRPNPRPTPEISGFLRVGHTILPVRSPIMGPSGLLRRPVVVRHAACLSAHRATERRPARGARTRRYATVEPGTRAGITQASRHARQ